MRPKNQRGLTMIDLTCGFAVLSVLALGLGVSGRGHGHALTRAFGETVALRVAQAHLEELRAQRRALFAGRAPFELDAAAQKQLPAARGTRAVRPVAPGLFEVEVRVQWIPAGASQPAVVHLTTLLAAEESR